MILTLIATNRDSLRGPSSADEGRHKHWVLAAALVVLTTSLAHANAETPTLAWSDLRTPSQSPATIASLTGADPIRIEGYLLPVDREGDKIYEFILVPYPGACSHMPQPPPDQLIHVFLKQPYRATGNYDPVAVTGKLKAENEQTQLFMIDGVKVIESDYAISLAEVAPATTLAPPPPVGNPLLSKRK